MRDSVTQDYADQRYYAVGMGRFGTPDPYMANNGGPGDPDDPASWNRYAFVAGDPVNYVDPSGQAYGPAPPDPPAPNPAPPIPDPPTRKPPSGPAPLDPPPTLEGASKTKNKKFTNAIKAAESKLKKSGSPCASDFGADALATLDSATYKYGLSFATDANGDPTAIPDPNIYASTDPSTGTVTINMVGYFFDISPTPIAGTDRAVIHDMGTGLSQTNFDAFVLLHELGHLTGVLGDDRGKNQSLADNFNAKILNDCFGIADWHPPL
jgi:RHS repeat-associated protein